MIRTILTVLGLMFASALFGAWWQANPQLHASFLGWADYTVSGKCPRDTLCTPVSPAP